MLFHSRRNLMILLSVILIVLIGVIIIVNLVSQRVYDSLIAEFTQESIVLEFDVTELEFISETQIQPNEVTLNIRNNTNNHYPVKLSVNSQQPTEINLPASSLLPIKLSLPSKYQTEPINFEFTLTLFDNKTLNYSLNLNTKLLSDNEILPGKITITSTDRIEYSSSNKPSLNYEIKLSNNAEAEISELLLKTELINSEGKVIQPLTVVDTSILVIGETKTVAQSFTFTLPPADQVSDRPAAGKEYKLKVTVSGETAGRQIASQFESEQILHITVKSL